MIEHLGESLLAARPELKQIYRRSSLVGYPTLYLRVFSVVMRADHRNPSIWLFRAIIAVAVCFVTGCAHKPTLVVTVGGLGFSQMGNVRRAIEKQCPNADVVSAGAWDAFKTDLPKILRESPHDYYVLVGHSLGCQTIAETAKKVSKVDLLVFLDPASDDIRLPRNVQQCLWYQRSNFDFFARAAKVMGASPWIIKGGHNDVPQSPEVIAAVVKAVNGIPASKRR